MKRALYRLIKFIMASSLLSRPARSLLYYTPLFRRKLKDIKDIGVYSK
ncbi:MAG: hypothetical protein LBP51_05475 [Deferribacteraceae bacterium]|nr:hypothetical protein [Deferribacteraceae bacterium]